MTLELLCVLSTRKQVLVKKERAGLEAPPTSFLEPTFIRCGQLQICSQAVDCIQKPALSIFFIPGFSLQTLTLEICLPESSFVKIQKWEE